MDNNNKIIKSSETEKYYQQFKYDKLSSSNFLKVVKLTPLHKEFYALELLKRNKLKKVEKLEAIKMITTKSLCCIYFLVNCKYDQDERRIVFNKLKKDYEYLIKYIKNATINDIIEILKDFDLRNPFGDTLLREISIVLNTNKLTFENKTDIVNALENKIDVLYRLLNLKLNSDIREIIYKKFGVILFNDVKHSVEKSIKLCSMFREWLTYEKQIITEKVLKKKINFMLVQ